MLFALSTMDNNLHQLLEMFPHLPYENLKIALKSANNDLELSISILLSESSSEQLENNDEIKSVDQELLQMFPKLTLDTIKKSLGENNDSIEDTITHLLTIELIQNENKSGSSNNESSGNTTINNNNANLIGNNNFWKNKDHNIHLIVKFTLVKDSIKANELYFNNNCNVKTTIINIINNNIKYTPHMEHKTQTINFDNNSKFYRNKKIGGRVQASYIRQTKSQPTTRNSTPEPNANFIKKETIKSADGLEISQTEQKLLNNNDSFKVINKQFIKNCANYFNGDLELCNNLLKLIINWNCEALTFNINSIEDDSTIKNDNKFILTDSLKKKRSKKLDDNLKQIHDSNVDSLLTNLFIDYKLDFHGLLVQQALLILNKAMKKWWLEEMSQRELNNTPIKLVKVKYVKNLKVTTGRGLHSQDGFSKIKLNVRKYLQLNQYQFWEEPSYFEIYGRKNGVNVL